MAFWLFLFVCASFLWDAVCAIKVLSLSSRSFSPSLSSRTPKTVELEGIGQERAPVSFCGHHSLGYHEESPSLLLCVLLSFFVFFFLLSVVAVLCQQGSAEFVAEVWFEGLQLAGGLSHVAARDQILGEGHRLRQVHHAVPPTMRDEDDIPCLLNQLQRPRVRFEQRVNFVEPSNRRRRVVHHSVVHRPRGHPWRHLVRRVQSPPLATLQQGVPR